jgi:hypothetical protein
MTLEEEKKKKDSSFVKKDIISEQIVLSFLVIIESNLTSN